MNKVLIIDSGIGGLNVLKVLYKKLNISNFIYFADLKNIPYGSKTKSELKKLTINNLKKLIKKYKPTLIVFGCNTIGSTIFDDLKSIFPNEKMFAIKPNIEYVINRLTNKENYLKNEYKSKILLLCTTATGNSIAKNNLYIKNKNSIVLYKMPRLATKVEKYIQSAVNIVPYLNKKLNKYSNINCVMLGCTHYIYFKKYIEKLYKNTIIFDGTEELLEDIMVAVETESFKGKKNKLNVKFSFSFKHNKLLKNKYETILNNLLKE